MHIEDLIKCSINHQYKLGKLKSVVPGKPIECV